MILCVDTSALKPAPYVQKDVNLEEILTKHTKYYPTVAEAEKDHFVPLDFSVSMRTVYTNLVLQVKTVDKYLYYVNQTMIGKFVHKGYDLMMYLSAIGLMSYVDYSYAWDNLMMESSIFQPIGLYEPDLDVINPIILSHIIIKDDAVDSLKTFLKPNVELVPLDVMRQRKEGNLSALLDTLIDVKKGDNDNDSK